MARFEHKHTHVGVKSTTTTLPNYTLSINLTLKFYIRGFWIGEGHALLWPNGSFTHERNTIDYTELTNESNQSQGFNIVVVQQTILPI